MGFAEEGFSKGVGKETLQNPRKRGKQEWEWREKVGGIGRDL